MSATAAIEAAKTKGGPVRRHAQATGVLLSVLGLLGLVPGITTRYDEMGLWGSGAQLFGLFTVSVTTSVLLFLYGVTVLVFAGSVRQAHKSVVLHALLLIGMGITGTGLVNNSPARLLPTDAASNVLYLVLGVVLLVSANRSRAKEIEQNGVF
ncbi:DUF4383 domain-containing protein [Kineococcus indalonis]|uniref:DUF4383 domain-containing protein n=1 Tax=Kineococcus indalonis TaxID=2696566 RepID=UPI0014133F90|nr:DUF4383 domain-containing protein [Kineococcus indalonis]NAZ88488.1 DUF4383 domain-containing protein [Kineococcus indalonis]